MQWHWQCVSINLFTTIKPNIQKYLEEYLGWIINSIIDHTISISKYNPSARSGCIKLPKELDHPRNGSINIQNSGDNGCFKWQSHRP